METETKHLRGKLFAFQLWLEDQVEKGLIDIEATPPVFDRNRKKNLEPKPSTLSTTCYECEKSLEFDKVTEDHVRWFCNNKCLKNHFDKEEIALTRQDK